MGAAATKKPPQRGAPRERIRVTATRRWPALAVAVALDPLCLVSLVTLALALLVAAGPEPLAREVWVELDAVAAYPLQYLVWFQAPATVAAGLLYFGVPRTTFARARKDALELRVGRRWTALRRPEVSEGLVTVPWPGSSRLILQLGSGLGASELSLTSDGDRALQLAKGWLGERRGATLAGASLGRIAMSAAIGGGLGALGALLLWGLLSARKAGFSPPIDPALSDPWMSGTITACVALSMRAVALLSRPTTVSSGLDGLALGERRAAWSEVSSIEVRAGSLGCAVRGAWVDDVTCVGADRARLSGLARAAMDTRGRTPPSPLALPRYEGDARAWAVAIAQGAQPAHYRALATATSRAEDVLFAVGVEPEARLGAALRVRATRGAEGRGLVMAASREVVDRKVQAALVAIARRRGQHRAIDAALRAA